jgi:hypothetical protein
MQEECRVPLGEWLAGKPLVEPAVEVPLTTVARVTKQ